MIRSNVRLTFSFFTVFGLAGALAPLGCSSAPKPYTAQPATSSSAAENAETAGNGENRNTSEVIASPLTETGENFLPSFSPDGKRLIFISEKREGHSQAQIYEIDLTTHVEKRITFQDGDVGSVSYFPDGQRILYSSSTDEIKEDPYFIHQLRKRFTPAPASVSTSTETGADTGAEIGAGPGMNAGPTKRILGTLEPLETVPSELYQSRLDGSEIRRLTKSRGFDGHSALAPDGRLLAFVSIGSGKHDLFTMSPDGRGKRRLTSDPEREMTPAFSSDGRRLAWIRLAKDFSSSQIYIADGPSWTAVPLTLQPAIYAAPTWHPNGKELIFTSNRGDGKKFDIYSLDPKNHCLKRLTESESDELFPAFSPDGSKIAFSGNNSGRFQIYSMDYRPPSTCLPSP